MALTKSQAETVLSQLIPQIRTLIYNGEVFKVFDTYLVVPVIELEQGIVPNGNLTPVAGNNKMGVAVSQGLLNLGDDTAIKFALGHELGHGFSEKLLMKLRLGAVGGCVTEVIADLGAAYMLNTLGTSWTDIVQAARAGVNTGIFDAGWSGDHPPGAERATCVETLAQLIQAGEDFEPAAAAICLSMQGRGPHGQAPAKQHGKWCRFKTWVKKKFA